VAKRGKALTRKITRKRALSYDRMAPNKRGVTALSEVNGRGAYQQRYAKTRALLENSMPKMTKAETQMYKRQLRKGRSPAQAAATVRMLRKSPTMKRNASPTKRSSVRKKTSRSATKTKTTKRVMKPNLKKDGKRVLKGDYIAQQMRKGRSKKEAENDWKLASGVYKRAKKRKNTPRTYGKGKGKFRALKARVGDKSRYTYYAKSKKGNTRKIPDYALMGYESSAEVTRIKRYGTDKEQATLRRRMQKLLDQRIRASRKAERRALAGQSWFSPNASDETITFEEYTKMKKNRASKASKAKRKPRKKTTARKGRTTKAKFIAAQKRKGRSAAQAQAAWDISHGKHKSKGGGKKSTAKRKRKSTTKSRSKGPSRAPVKSGKKATPAQRKARIRNLKKGCTKVRQMKANGKGAYKSKTSFVRSMKSKGLSHAQAENAYKLAKRSSGRKGKPMKANAVGAMYREELKNSFKYGAIVTGSFVVHRALMNLADKHLLSKVEALGTESVAPFRKSLAGLLVAAVGIPLTVRALPRNAGVAAAGMAASALLELVITGLKQAGQQEIVEAVSSYPNAEGYAQYSGMGSYYEFSPHEVYGAPMGGMGEFYETSYIPGLEQAAAGMHGGMSDVQGGQMLSQAAAGLQQMYANPMGEYYAYGADGIGEYESVPNATSGFGAIDDGIAPNLHSAEQALDVAEAAAGIGGMVHQAAAGFGDLPLEQTVQPSIRAMDIPDMPGGSRAGILAGGDGIFG